MIQRLYDLSYLRDVRLAKRLFPAPDPVPAPRFPKPGQTIRLVHSPADELPPPAFPKPSQLNRLADRPRKFARRCKGAPVKLSLVGAAEKVPPVKSSVREVTGNVPGGHARAGVARPAAAPSSAPPQTVEYLAALADLASNELSRAAIKEDWNAVTRCFGTVPDAALFAHGYEQYLVDREAVADPLRRVFLHYSWWLNLKRGGAHE